MMIGTAIRFGLAMQALVWSPALLAQRPEAPPYAMGTGESARYTAAAAAGTRALNICSGLWSGGLDRATIERELNGRDPTYGKLAEGIATRVDERARTVTIRYEEGVSARLAVWRPVLGCVLLPAGADAAMAAHLPQAPAGFRAPDLDAQPWPMGDRNAVRRLPAVQQRALDAVVARAFDEAGYGGRTWGVVVVADGKIVAERYAPGYGMHIGSQTHSAAKSMTATLAGIAIDRKLIALDQPGVLAAWRRPGDPRGAITVRHLLQMRSGLYTEGVASLFKNIYNQGGAVRDLAPTNFLDTVPGDRFVYAPTDTMLTMLAIREGLGDDAAFLRFPYESLFWKVGMTRTTMNGDWDGSIFGSGQTWSTARDFARFGLLYLNDGLWGGERVLPAGWARFVGPPDPRSRSRRSATGRSSGCMADWRGCPRTRSARRAGRGISR